ncbi:glutathione S-transferase family protein [Spirulina sp. 06S082]|uniref:glutathione S-transferase family protein n=1 Tax=Spirulina sp. 06S082 TaxID=3110248 RepID=UPI002B20ED9D|nr:glutathione S-transferase family protein [Spirulina sp. 06S082]MEA5471809.1 glutathione S-transferase family protein [Spirulina sp. 06S082]
MLLLQFSTSHYCRKARLALGYKKIAYQVENLTPGLHILKLRPLTGLTTVPVLLPQQPGEPEAIADSTAIFKYLDKFCPEPSLYPTEPILKKQTELLEDWLDESIGTATRFVYYDYRAGEGQSIDPSLFSRLLINVVRRQYGITPGAVKLARSRLLLAMQVLSSWQESSTLVGDTFSIADLAAAALLSPLALLPEYREAYPWIFDRIREVHDRCNEPLPPGF